METKETKKAALAARKQENLMRGMAAKYRELSLRLKELEAQAAPMKKALTEYAREVGLPTIDLGDVMVDRRNTSSFSFDREAVSPDWLYRLQQAGLMPALKLGIDEKKLTGCEECACLMREISLAETVKSTYVVRLKPQPDHV